ncbi:cystathionine gamma-synthase [Fretibacter rubidus]|uniref:cystathionine gamma-synthase n=1 Tax=Fretibacter rubidus TaxID=570162 RepID=UPI00352B7657
MTDKKHISTQTVQAEIGADPAFGSVPPPLYLSSTYLWPSVAQKGPYDYGRTNNPNRDGLARALATLEGGAGAVITSSGMSAIDLVFNLLKADDLIIAPHDCYGGTHRLLTHRAQQGRMRVEFVDQGNADALGQALGKKPALILIETPSNPLMRLVDIAAICKAAKAVGAITMVDNTFLSPVRQQPLTLGADVVIHSTTKYLNGHSDIIGGAVIAKTADMADQLAWWANCIGVTGAAFDSHQTLRGLRTLALRMDKAEANALAIAKWLHKQRAVSKVYYPGLKSDPGHKLMKRQQSGPGAMLSFELKAGAKAATDLAENIDIFGLAASLGGVESLICQPSTMTHRGMAEEARREAGITDDLLRISVGIEDSADLIKALEDGFAQIG